MTERRKFLTQWGVAVIAAALAPRTLLAKSLRGVDPPSQRKGLDKDGFTAMLGRSLYFHGASPGNQAQVKLVEVLDYPFNAELEQFAVVFQGGAKQRLPDGVYTASGRENAPFHVYIKPTEGDDRQQFYVAEFSLLQ